MKLRQLPQDFIVEEVSQHNILEKGRFKLYELAKKEIETFYFLNFLSRKNGIPKKDIGIAGMKDKYAITKQYFTIPSKYTIKTLSEDNFNITFAGFTDKEIKTGDLIGNNFELTIRDLHKHELKRMGERAEELAKYGVLNYFDSQRFGSVSKGSFIAKEIIKKNYENAVKLYLTHYADSEPKQRKDEKRRIRDNWDNLAAVKVYDNEFKEVIDAYLKTKSWLECYKQIPTKLKQLFISAYQSYLWNECVKEIIKRAVKGGVYSVGYSVGSLFFYKKISEDEQKKIPLEFPLLSENVKLNDFEREIVELVLQKEGITLLDFKNMNITGMNFQSPTRNVISKPEQLEISAPEIDELNDKGKGNRFKVKLFFFLAKGSYATVVTKRIFGD